MKCTLLVSNWHGHVVSFFVSELLYSLQARQSPTTFDFWWCPNPMLNMHFFQPILCAEPDHFLSLAPRPLFGFADLRRTADCSNPSSSPTAMAYHMGPPAVQLARLQARNRLREVCAPYGVGGGGDRTTVGLICLPWHVAFEDPAMAFVGTPC
jgi:hypothetical protein